MVKNKNNTAIWSSRINQDVSKLFLKVGNSINVDNNIINKLKKISNILKKIKELK